MLSVVKLISNSLLKMLQD